MPCGSHCDVCDDSGCQTCENNTVLFPGGVCLGKCPGAFYESADRQCRSCGNGCALCTSNSSCTTCGNGLALFNGTCVFHCPSGYKATRGATLVCEAIAAFSGIEKGTQYKYPLIGTAAGLVVIIITLVVLYRRQHRKYEVLEGELREQLLVGHEEGSTLSFY